MTRVDPPLDEVFNEIDPALPKKWLAQPVHVVSDGVLTFVLIWTARARVETFLVSAGRFIPLVSLRPKVKEVSKTPAAERDWSKLVLPALCRKIKSAERSVTKARRGKERAVNAGRYKALGRWRDTEKHALAQRDLLGVLRTWLDSPH